MIRTDRRGWTEQEAKDFIKEVERLKELWYPGREPTTTEALKNLANDYPKARRNLEKMNAERREENERIRNRRLCQIELENRNLEWPKPSEDFKIRRSEDYYKNNGCIYCGYKPKTTHDYEVHIVTQHPGNPAYPGPADLR